MIRTLIIDDEPSAVSLLSNMLRKKFPHNVEIIATTNDPLEGRELIDRHQPDLVFLDVQMPGMTGIDLARSFDNPRFHIVFVTAFDSFAMEAFRVSAFDYLLKPIDAVELERVIQKIKPDRAEDHQLRSQFQKLEQLLTRHNEETGKRIGIAMADRVVFVQVSDILYCEANGPYTQIHLTGSNKLVSSKTLGEFEEQLCRQKFCRIHHSFLINLEKVREYKKLDGGYVIMENEARLEISQRKKKDFVEAITAFTV